MLTLNKQQIFDKIQNIIFKDGSKLLDVISDIVIKNHNIGFSIDISNKNIHEAEEIKNTAISKLQELSQINKITIIFTSNKNTNHKSTRQKYFIENVKKVILIASGKGGVGKSTVTALIAEQLKLNGYKVGILDADIYGPSIPHMFNIKTFPITSNDQILPIKARDIQIMSIGFFVKDHSAIIWRGPMASKTIYKLLSNTKWDNLDYLIIDMPPGTGDIHLSILENYYLDGVIIVTTPQKIAEIDVIRSIDLYQKLGVPILGLIENMSYMIDPNSGKNISIFSGNSGEHLAKKYNIKLLDKIAIIPNISNACDNGLSLANIIKLSLEI